MRKVTIGLVVLGVLALAFISMPMRAQNQTYPFPGYPPEFAPSRTARALPPARPSVPPNKFNRVQGSIPNEYIVVLSDDILPQNVSATAHALANAHGGVIKHTYSTALKGLFSSPA